MGYYRFIQSRYLDSVLDGNLRFTALSYYRLMEMVYEDEWIGDSQEGQAFTKIKVISLRAGEDRDGARKKLEDIGFIRGSNMDLSIENANFVFEENGFVLSFAVGELEELKESMWRDSYDACLSLVDLEAFALLVYEHGVDDLGRKASDLFCHPLVDTVVYGINEVDLLLVDKPLEGNPLLKREKYRDQKECRIFFKPKTDLDVDVVTLALNIPAGYMSEEYRNTSPPQIKKWVEPETFPDPLGKLRDVRSAIDALRRRGEEIDKDELERLTFIQVRSAKFAYWQLRQEKGKAENRWDRLDRFFSMKKHHGGAITHFIYLLDLYFERVTGIPRWG